MNAPEKLVELVNHKKQDAEKAVSDLEKKYGDRFEINSKLNRSVVSFQANKAEPIFRWFKYREGFSRQLINYCLDELGAREGQTILDPFSGTGATVFTSAAHGLNGFAVELLPVGCYFMKARQFLKSTPPEEIIQYAKSVLIDKPWKQVKPEWKFPHLNITLGAFSAETEDAISRYKSWLTILGETEAVLMDFVLFSVLEEISFTRKDGQYLRWDHRSPRTKNKTSFDKGKVYSFDEAIEHRLKQIIHDLTEIDAPRLFEEDAKNSITKQGAITIYNGSIFDAISRIENHSIDYVITSPPYCNRYDYTRTYALELAYLGVGEDEIRQLRQTLLTCTVENRPKNFGHIESIDLMAGTKAFNENSCLHAVLEFLEVEKNQGSLNNNGIYSMVRGYFFDTAVHLAQVSRKMRKGGAYVMVNDNVRYNGLPIPIDCLLSELAESVGFKCEKIWVLPVGKGNSSQQMKKHGRSELRKCVYVWRKV